jgi:MYXO-CTERM domain-containing protein
MYTLASLNLKSDAQTKYTTGGKVWTFNSTFDGANVGQEAWTFATAVPTPGACVFLGLAGIFARRRRTNLTRTEIKHAVQNNIAMRFEAHMDMS